VVIQALDEQVHGSTRMAAESAFAAMVGCEGSDSALRLTHRKAFGSSKRFPNNQLEGRIVDDANNEEKRATEELQG
jgi:hypothetical protein